MNISTGRKLKRLMSVIAESVPFKPNMTTLSEVLGVSRNNVSDFKVGDYTFEVGGRKKKQKQIMGVEKAFVVKDDIEYGSMNVIPLWMFGMLY